MRNIPNSVTPSTEVRKMESRDRAKLLANADAIITELDVSHVLLYLSGTVLTSFECDKIHAGRTKTERAQRLINILQTKGSLAYQHFRYSLKERYPLLVKKLDDTAMRENPIISSEEGRKRILKHYDTLVLNIKTEDVLLYLRTEGVLTDDDCRKIKASMTKEDQTRALLEMIPEKGDKAYQHFTVALKGQQPRLAQLLENDRS